MGKPYTVRPTASDATCGTVPKGGYGGLVPSLRGTKLDRAGIVEVIRCGRPGKPMPYFETKAWDEGRCYGGAKRPENTPGVFPLMLGGNLSEREIQSVADYVIAVLKGKGAPTREECLAFWGSEAVKVSETYGPSK